MVYRLFHLGVQIKTKANRDNLYVSLSSAKKALRQYLIWANKKIRDKNLQVKSHDCSICRFELIVKEEYQI